MEIKKISKNEKESLALVNLLNFQKNENYIICMSGELGSGKTLLTKGIARNIGVRDDITSPTFTIIKEYKGQIPLYHMDVYRLDGNVEGIGFYDYLVKDGVIVIEWADLLDELPSERLEISIKIIDENRRFIKLNAYGKKYEDLLEELDD